MRHESLYLTDILQAADYIAEFIEGADFEDFQKSEMLREFSASLHDSRRQ